MTQEILQLAKEYRRYTAETLSSMIKIPSLSGEEGPLVEHLTTICETAGFDEVRVDGLGNLLCRIGTGSTVLAIDGHIDTVDTGDLEQWEKDPFSGEIDDTYVYGRGSVDQEGGVAAMITAGRILHELSYNGGFTIWFTFTIMEEDADGLCWLWLIEREGIKPDFVVITEPTNLGVYRGHRGRMELDVSFRGVSAHGSAPERGDNAIYKASRGALALEKLNEELRPDPFLGKGTIVISRVTSSAPSLCAVADGAELHVDRRLTWGETKEIAVQQIQEVCGPDAKVSVTMYDRVSYTGAQYPQEAYFPTWKIPEEHRLVRAGARTFRELFDAQPVVDKWTFSTNAVSICGKYEIPTIGFGPGNEVQAHAPNEHTPIDHLEKASAFYALLPFILEDTE